MPKKHNRRDLSAELSNQEQEPNILLNATNTAFDVSEKISNVGETIESINKTTDKLAKVVDNTIENTGKFISDNIEFYSDVQDKVKTAVLGFSDKVQETAENDNVDIEQNTNINTKSEMSTESTSIKPQNTPNGTNHSKKRQRYKSRRVGKSRRKLEQFQQAQENNVNLLEISDKVVHENVASDKVQKSSKNDKINAKGSIGNYDKSEKLSYSKKKKNHYSRRVGRSRRELEQSQQENSIQTLLCEELDLPPNTSEKFIVDELVKRAEYGIKLPEIVQIKLDNIKAISEDLLATGKFDQHDESTVSRNRKISLLGATSEFRQFFHQNPTNSQIIKSKFFSLQNLNSNYVPISFNKITDKEFYNENIDINDKIHITEKSEDNDKITTSITFERNHKLIGANKQLEKISDSKFVGFIADKSSKIGNIKNTIDDGTGLTLKESITYDLAGETAQKVSTKFEKIDAKLNKKAERLIKQVETENKKFAKDLKHAKFTQAKMVAGHVMQSDTRQETVNNDVSMDISDLAMHHAKENIKAVSDTLEKALLKATAPTKTDVQNKINQERYSQKKKATEKAIAKEHKQDKKATKAENIKANKHKKSNKNTAETSESSAIDFSKPLSKKDLEPSKSSKKANEKVLSTKSNRKISFERYQNATEINGDNGLSRKVSFEKHENAHITANKSNEKISTAKKPKEKTKEFAYSSKGKVAIHKAINLKNFSAKRALQAKSKEIAKKVAMKIVRRVAIVVAKMVALVMALALKILLILLALLAILLPIILLILFFIMLLASIISWFDFNTPDVSAGSNSAVIDYFRSLEDYLYFGDPTVFEEGITPPNPLFTVDNDALLGIYENNLGTTLHEINRLRVDPQGHDPMLLIMFLAAKYGNFSDTHDYIVLVNEFFFRNSPSFPLLGSTFGQYEMITELRTESRINDEGIPYTAYVLDVTLINHFWDDEEQFIEGLKESLTDEQRDRFESLLENGFLGGYLVASPFEVDWRNYVTSSMGLRNISNTGSQYHNGIDIAGGPAVSNAPILAGLDGIVLSSSVRNGYGETIIIYDPIRDVSALYAHMVAGSRQVSEGDTVYVGQHIGNVGNTGITFGVTGIHLHIEIWENTGGRLVFQETARPYLRDPELFLQPGIGAVIPSITEIVNQFQRISQANINP